eukprot:CAMPEP_0116143616 /NCGR_PEP_ID=MMETSP0329-20121206/15549_1 /TAXON_ID=697910 /ORGANISM="Pseudo-nitzschia arenysensis, Strain B593" /LENGTH=338 /DNA_ID=CAMNT_0003638955 /DNA_START=73 /DNA_END=1089 /DNA_ORIENTATION=+
MMLDRFPYRGDASAGRKSALLLAYVVLMSVTIVDAWNTSPTKAMFKPNLEGNQNEKIQNDDIELSTRRSILRQGAATLMVGTASLMSPLGAVAEDAAATKEGLMSPTDVADLIRPIPTFAIVDKKGVPFTVVGEDAKVTGYFFTTYSEASRILQLAKKSADKAIAKAKADKEEDVGDNPWKNARVSTVPLDYAATLVIKSVRNSGGGVYFKVAPAEDDVDDALAVTGEKDLTEGKVPLFYYEDFTIDDDGKQKTPLYFRKEELEKQWRLSKPNEDLPKPSVTELFSVLTALVRPGGANEDFKNIVFVAPKESESKRKECLKKAGNEPAFVVGKRIIVL